MHVPTTFVVAVNLIAFLSEDFGPSLPYKLIAGIGSAFRITKDSWQHFLLNFIAAPLSFLASLASGHSPQMRILSDGSVCQRGICLAYPFLQLDKLTVNFSRIPWGHWSSLFANFHYRISFLVDSFAEFFSFIIYKPKYEPLAAYSPRIAKGFAPFSHPSIHITCEPTCCATFDFLCNHRCTIQI